MYQSRLWLLYSITWHRGSAAGWSGGKHVEALSELFHCREPRVCLISGTVPVLIWIAVWTCVQMYPRQHVIMRAHTHDCEETNKTDKLTPRHVNRTGKLSCHSSTERTHMHVHSHSRAHSNTPSCGSELIPPAVLPSALSHTLPPPLLACPALPVSCVQGWLMEQQKVAVCKWAQTRQIDTRPTDWSRSAWPFICYTGTP